MNLINSAKKIVVSLAVLATVCATITSASAQGQYDSQNRWTRSHMSRFAFALGYSRGYDDAAQGNYRSYRELQRWREGTEGWEDPMGPRASFRDIFRRGFAQGFMDARRVETVGSLRAISTAYEMNSGSTTLGGHTGNHN